MIRCSEGTYDWVRVIVDCDHARIEYRATESDIHGRDHIDDDVSNWIETDFQMVAGSMLDIVPEDRKLIEVCYA